MRAHWYESRWSVFWTIVGALLTAGALGALASVAFFWISANIALRSFDEVMSRAQVEQPARPVERREPRPELAEALRQEAQREMVFPPRSHAECIEQTSGRIDPQYQRCRSGWRETVETR